MSEELEHQAADVPTIVVLLVGVVAAVLGIVAATVMWRAPNLPAAAGAIGLHVTAALLTRLTARLGGASACERDLVLVLSLSVPLFGPCLAWMLCWRPAPDASQNAHAAFESELQVSSEVESPELERELGVRSHAQILQHGSLEEKRNLLRQLTRIGERRYLLLLRHFLRDHEPELRLCAYAELARECQLREEHIGALREQADAIDQANRAAVADARAELAAANREYGISGLLDEDMGHYWLEQARGLAEQALAADGTCRTAQCALALALAELGDLDRAWALVVDWPGDVEPEMDLARAEIAFRRRDRGTCLAVAARLVERGESLPEWLAETAGRREVRGAAAESADASSGGQATHDEVAPGASQSVAGQEATAGALA